MMQKRRRTPRKRRLVEHLKLSTLRAVEAIDTHRSLLKASVALAISQPALSRSLQELEGHIQLTLFERHPRGVRPTDAGNALVRAARRILNELRRLDEELDDLGAADCATVAIGALPVAAAGILPGVLTRLRRQRPDLRVQLRQGRTEELLPLLASGEVDLIVGRLYDLPLPDGFGREALWTEPLSVLARAGHPLFAEDGVPVERLRAFDLVLPSITQRVGQEVDTLLDQLGLNVPTSLRSTSYGFIREMLHETDAVSVMPRLMMAGDLMRGSLRVLPVPLAAPDRPAGLIVPAGSSLSPASQAVTDCLRAYVAELVGCGIAAPFPHCPAPAC